MDIVFTIQCGYFMSSMASTDNVPVLMCQLGTLHLDQALRSTVGFWSHEQKQLKQRKLKCIAFETVFRYLQDHSYAQLVMCFFV